MHTISIFIIGSVDFGLWKLCVKVAGIETCTTWADIEKQGGELESKLIEFNTYLFLN